MSQDKTPSKASGSAKPISAAENERLRELIMRLQEQATLDNPQTKLEREEEKEKSTVHEFWATQPVPKSTEVIKKDGPLHPPLKPEEIPKDPYPLPSGLAWDMLDIDDEAQMKELYELLSNNYVEDSDSMFRFNYSPAFLHWALKPPGYESNWHVGVRDTATKELLGFISGIPVDVLVRDNTIKMTEINFLCVHKSLRSKRLAPLMIQEVTRRVHLKGIFQAVYTVGKLLPKPISTCRYYHRSLNMKKLVETGFSARAPGPELNRIISMMRLPTMTSTPGLRPMRKGDCSQVRKLLNRYLKTRFDFVPIFRTDAEISHWFLPRDGVVWTFVVDDPENKGKLSDFFSFYSLPSSVLKPSKGKKTAAMSSTTINAAYCYYYATKTDYDVSLTPEETAKCEGFAKREKAAIKEKENALIKKRLTALMRDALILAKNADFDVCNCLHIMDNEMFTEELKFGPGDGYLHYYLFNWRSRPIEHGKIGLVML